MTKKNNFPFFKYNFLIILSIFLLQSCVGIKYLKKNEVLIAKKSGIHHAPEELEEELAKNETQKPNTKILKILPFSPKIYYYKFGTRKHPQKYIDRIEKFESLKEKIEDNNISNDKLPKRLDKLNKKIEKNKKIISLGNYWMKRGEKLAVYDSLILKKTIEKMRYTLKAKGYFNSKIDYSINKVNKNAIQINYYFDVGSRFVIDSLVYQVDDSLIIEILKINNLILQKGLYFDIELINNIKTNTFNTLKNNGYYKLENFNIQFQIDTINIKNNKIILTTSITDDKEKLRQYTIDSIIFISKINNEDSILFNTDYDNKQFLFGQLHIKPHLINDKLYINKGDLFSFSNKVKTEQQLNSIDFFRYAHVNYFLQNQKLYSVIQSSPLNKYQMSVEGGGISEQQIPGIYFKPSLKIRNFLKQMDILNIIANITFQGNLNVSNIKDVSLNNYYSVYFLFNLPRFIFPHFHNKTFISYFSYPSTIIDFNILKEVRGTEYERNIVNTSYSYVWSFRNSSRFRFTPFSFSFIEVTNLSDNFKNFLEQQTALGNGTLVSAFNSSLINSSSINATFDKNNYGNYSKNATFFRFFIENGGHYNFLTAQLLESNSSLLAFKWSKLDFSVRQFYLINNKSSFLWKLNLGYGHPYGENLSLPYEKRFYIGGNSSVRAWLIRRLGPGAYGKIKKLNELNGLREIDYQLEQSGDFLIETSLEYRKNLIGKLDYALFVDVGNIWVVNSNTNLKDEDGDNGEFDVNTFINEFGVGVGLGLRLNLSVVVIRLDGGVQVVDPAQAIGKRIIFDNLNVLNPFVNSTNTDLDFFLNKSSLNFAIGFPF